MSNIFAIANQKGGVGKTTTTVNLAAALVSAKRRVLLIDLDPQGNATMGSGVDKNQLDASMNEVLLGDALLSDVIVNSENGYALAPANNDLTMAEVKLLEHDQREQHLANSIASLTIPYDFIFIDCPPALNILTLNALVAAHGVLVPMQCEYYALEGLAGLLKTIEQIRASVNPQLQISGILRTMYDGRNRLSHDVSEQLLSHFGDTVYRTVIPRNVRLAEAPSHGLSAILYDKHSPGAVAYLVLAGEFIGKHKKTMRDAAPVTTEV